MVQGPKIVDGIRRQAAKGNLDRISHFRNVPHLVLQFNRLEERHPTNKIPTCGKKKEKD